MKITLREINPNHAEAVQALAPHPDILANTNMPSPYPADGAITFINESVELRGKGQCYVFAAMDENTLVGLVGLHNIHEGAAELGYWVGRDYWGQGIATQAINGAVAFAFGQLKLDRIAAHCLVTNRPSFHLLEKAGFHLTAVKPMADCKWSDPIAFFEQRLPMWEIGQGI